MFIQAVGFWHFILAIIELYRSCNISIYYLFIDIWLIYVNGLTDIFPKLKNSWRNVWRLYE